MQRGLGAITATAFLILIGGMLVRPANGWYAPSYHLREWAFVAAAAYLFATYWWMRTADASRVHRVRYVQAALFVAAVLVFVVYHHAHVGDKHPSGLWRGDYFYEITPYHQQLAIPVLLGLLLPLFIVTIVPQTERSDRRQQIA